MFTMKFDRRSLISTPILLTTVAGPPSARAQQTHAIVGTWQLLSLYDEKDGVEIDVFGQNPKGRLILDNARFFSFILLTSAPLTSPACSRRTAPVVRDTVGPGTIAYYGSYSLNNSNIINFHIENGLTGGWKGADRKAKFDVVGDKLNLISSFSSLTGSNYSHLTWGRICG